MVINFGYGLQDKKVAQYEKKLDELLSRIDSAEVAEFEAALNSLTEEYDELLVRLRLATDKYTLVNASSILTKHDILQAIILNKKNSLDQTNKETEIIKLCGPALTIVVNYIHDNPGIAHNELLDLYDVSATEFCLDMLYSKSFIAKAVYGETDFCYFLTNHGNSLYERIKR